MRRTDVRQGERGSALLELPFVLGLIVLPFALLVLQLPIWVERQMAAGDAAAEIARSVVVHGAEVDEGELLAAIESAHGLKPGSLTGFRLTPGLAGEAVVVEVTVEIPAITLPVFGSIGRGSWTATHVERMPDHGSLEQ